MGNVLACVDGPKAANVAHPANHLPGGTSASPMKQAPATAIAQASLFKVESYVATPFGVGKVNEVRDAMVVIALAFGVGYIRNGDCKPATAEQQAAYAAALSASSLKAPAVR